MVANDPSEMDYGKRLAQCRAQRGRALEGLSKNSKRLSVKEAAPDRKLRACATEYLTYFDEHRDLFRVLIYEREVTRVQGSRYQSERYQHLIQEVARVISEGVRSGAFRQVDSHNVAAMFIESMFALMNQRLRSEKPAPVDDDANLIADVLDNPHDEANIAAVRAKVSALTRDFPVYR